MTPTPTTLIINNGAEFWKKDKLRAQTDPHGTLLPTVARHDFRQIIWFINSHCLHLQKEGNIAFKDQLTQGDGSWLWPSEFSILQGVYREGTIKYMWRGMIIARKTTCLVRLCGALRVSPIVSRVECLWARRKEPPWMKYASFEIRALPIAWRVISDKLSSLCLRFLPVNNHSLQLMKYSCEPVA